MCNVLYWETCLTYEDCVTTCIEMTPGCVDADQATGLISSSSWPIFQLPTVSFVNVLVCTPGFLSLLTCHSFMESIANFSSWVITSREDPTRGGYLVTVSKGEVLRVIHIHILWCLVNTEVTTERYLRIQKWTDGMRSCFDFLFIQYTFNSLCANVGLSSPTFTFVIRCLMNVVG